MRHDWPVKRGHCGFANQDGRTGKGNVLPVIC